MPDDSWRAVTDTSTLCLQPPANVDVIAGDPELRIEAAYRVHKAGFDPNTGAQLVKGFFLNVSNYQPTDQLIQFGTWVSQCLEAVTAGAPWAIGQFGSCPGQYDPATNPVAGGHAARATICG